MNSKKKFLLFDLGGVIINLDTQRTINAFADLAGRPVQDIIDAWHNEPAFKEFERGEITEEQFRSFLRGWLKKPGLTDEKLDNAWNAMILDLPKERLDFLKSLKNEYQVLLLSNTNYIHMRCVSGKIRESVGEESLDPFFHACYYSHLMGMRKPEARIYNEILSLHKAQPEDFLFLDDNQENINGAKAVGIPTVIVKDPEEIFRVTDHV